MVSQTAMGRKLLGHHAEEQETRGTERVDRSWLMSKLPPTWPGKEGNRWSRSLQSPPEYECHLSGSAH